MRKRPLQNTAASVRQRLLNLAHERREEFGLILSRFGAERLLYRLSVSPWQHQFLLKGAMLFKLWSDTPHRPTRDVDLLGFGPPDLDAMVAIFRSLCDNEVEDDGIRFQAESVMAGPIREDNVYQGIRITLHGLMGSARIDVQVDIGFGDSVTPSPQEVVMPTLLDFPAPRLRAYSVYTVIAEKYHALVTLGMANSRMKDYFDLYTIARNQQLDGMQLKTSIAATFERRSTPLPEAIPVGLRSEFATDTIKQAQWNGFLRKNRLEKIALEEIVEVIAIFLYPLYSRPGILDTTTLHWPPGGPWQQPPQHS